MMPRAVQLPLLDDVARRQRPWKRTRQVSRAAFLEAERRGQIAGRQEIVGRVLRYLWNSQQRSATSARVAWWISTAGRHWRGRERSWVLLETRRALCDLRRRGLVDTKAAPNGREFLWRWREAGGGERPIEPKVG